MMNVRIGFVFVLVLVVVVGDASALKMRGTDRLYRRSDTLAGSVWPLPKTILPGSSSLSVDAPNFKVTTNSQAPPLANAIERYSSQLFFPFSPVSTPSGSVLSSLHVQVAEPENDVLAFGVDESYNLTIGGGSDQSAQLSATTIWGAMHGLETFSQLVLWNEASETYAVSGLPMHVGDEPRFAWRGLLVDSGRHFLSVATLLRAIDALSYNKMNVLHWHAVDAQSFPVESASYPRLSNGAYSPRARYSSAEIAHVVSYAKNRGVRVVVEFDVPGHAASWGVGYPTIVAQCPPSLSGNINNVPLNPTQNLTYEVLSGLLTDMSALFPDQYMHLGGDELVYSCWTQDPAIAAWMRANHMSTPQQLENYFESRLRSIVNGKLNRTMIVWQEVFQASGVEMSADTVVEVWKDQPTLESVIAAGHQAIYAAPYYLDKQIPGQPTFYEWVDTWKNFYASDPTEQLQSSANKHLVIGGEAAMWSEQVDSANFDSRVWPRASAVAERLWSPSYVNDVASASNRLAQFRCTSLAQRGIGAGPIMPDYCPVVDN
jgi:hexosaminidase